jgi:methionyl-tRNA formyltransferase
VPEPDTAAAPPPAGYRVAFAGTPPFAAAALQAVCDAGFTVPLVLTQPDRPAGRGLKLQPSAVKQLALARGLPLAQPRGLRLQGKYPDDAAAAQAALQAAAPDVLLVAAYGLLLPPWVLALHGGINIHGALLPRWRGAAPIQRAVEAGDALTGITLMQMDDGLDTGAMRLTATTPIGPDDTSATLYERLAALGAALAVQGLRVLAAGGALPATPQPAEGVTHAAKIDKAEAAVDWRRPAAEIERRLRAFDPAPGCHALLDDLPGAQPLKLWRARVVPAAELSASAEPGTRVDLGPGRLAVACGEGALELLEVQSPGGRRLPVAEWLRRGAGG